MKNFKIESVINGTTIKVTPRWKWESDAGTTYGQFVKINGYDVANPEYESLVVAMLEALLTPDKNDFLKRTDVKLRNPTRIDPTAGQIDCEVFVNGVDISEYFQAFNETMV